MTKRVRLAEYGTPRHGDYVRVFREGDRVRVQWGQPLQTESFPDTRAGIVAARAFGQAKSTDLGTGATARARETVRTVWDAYVADHFANLRPNTKKSYTRGYRLVADIVGWGKRANAVAIRDLQRVRRQLREVRTPPLAHGTVGEAINTFKQVFTWAEQCEMIPRNRLYSYRYTVPKDERPKAIAEYTLEEWTRMRATLDPMAKSDWRAWVAFTICGAQGARQHAVLHLQVADFGLPGDDPTMTWQGLWDKNGVTWTQPMREDAAAALVVAQHHHARLGYTGPWLLPAARASNQGPVYTIQSLWSKLRTAEDAAGVPHVFRRAGHGSRRMLAGDVWEMTGDALLALRAIGDNDPKMLQRYLASRDRRLRDVFGRLDTANRNAPATTAESDAPSDPSTQEK